MGFSCGLEIQVYNLFGLNHDTPKNLAEVNDTLDDLSTKKHYTVAFTRCIF